MRKKFKRTVQFRIDRIDRGRVFGSVKVLDEKGAVLAGLAEFECEPGGTVEIEGVIIPVVVRDHQGYRVDPTTL